MGNLETGGNNQEVSPPQNKETTSENPEVTYKQAREFAKAGKWEEAKGQYELYIKLVDITKIEESKLSNIGFAYMKTNDIDKAISFYVAALEKNPSNVTTLQNLAGAYRKGENFEKAITIYRKIETMGELTYIDKSNYGVCLRKVGRIQESIQILETIKKHNAISLSELGLSIKALGMRKGIPKEEKEQYLKASITKFQASLEKDPNNSITLSNLANAYIENGESEKAKETIDKSLELDPKNYKSMNILGKWLIYRGDRDEAKEVFLRSKAIEPNPSKNPLGNKAVLEIEKGQSNSNLRAILERFQDF